MAVIRPSPARLLPALRHTTQPGRHLTLRQPHRPTPPSFTAATTMIQPIPPSSRYQSTTTPPKRPLPPGTWDSHMHIVSPDTTRFPLAGTANYTPTPHTLHDMHQFYAPLGIQNMVFVQPSPYHTDNSLVLSALTTLGAARARGVVVIDPQQQQPPSSSTLQAWHAQGVRGARVNLVSANKTLTPAALRDTLSTYAALLRPLDWALQLYIPLSLCDDLEPLVPELGVKVVIDHFGNPPPISPADNTSTDPAATLQGFAALLRLLEAGSTWVKISGWYRLAQRPEDLDALAKALIGTRGGTRGVWASDWPHTRFDDQGIDVGPFVDACWRWCSEVGGKDGEAYAQRLFRGNAEELWGGQGS